MRLPEHRALRTDAGVDVVVVDWPGARFAELRVVLPVCRADRTSAARAHLFSKLLALHPDDEGAAAAAERMLTAGGRLSAAPGADRATVSGTIPADRIVATVGELVARVDAGGWRPTAVEETLRTEETMLRQAAAYPEIAIHRALTERRWGPHHPYAFGVVDPSDLAGDLGGPSDGAGTPFTWHGACVLVVADIGSLDSLVAQLVEQLAAARSTAPLPALPDADTEPGHVALPARAATASLRIAAPAPNREDPEHPAVLSAGVILGGYFGSRLNRELRERRGDVYGVSAGFDVLAGGSTLLLSMDCTGDRLERVRATVDSEFVDLLSRGPTAAELDAVTAYATNAATVGISSPAGLAGAGSAVVFAGDDLGMWERHAAAMRRLTPSAVAESARAHLAAERRIEIVMPAVGAPPEVGDR